MKTTRKEKPSEGHNNTSQDSIFDAFTQQLEKEDITLHAMIEDLLSYEANLSTFSQETKATLDAYGLDLQAPLKVRDRLEKLLKGE